VGLRNEPTTISQINSAIVPLCIFVYSVEVAFLIFPTMPSSLLHHPILGSLQGYTNSSKRTTEYRNIKYASIPARFQDPIPISYPPVSSSQRVLDCTKFGPSCPQNPSGFTYDVALVGEVPEMQIEMDRRENDIVRSGDSNSDELECLNLIVIVPEGSYDEPLPVMVWYVETESRYSVNLLMYIGYTGMIMLDHSIRQSLILHSGGFSVGANSWPQYDLSNFCKSSRDMNKPVITVSIK
jgi:hypothetical protein